MNAKTFVVTLLSALLAAAAGWLGRDLLSPTSAGIAPAGVSGPCPGGTPALYWRAPMDPTYVRNEPGKSPMGMDLVPECAGEGSGGAMGEIFVSQQVIQNMNVRTVRVKRRDLARSVRAVGRVDYDERLVEHVHTKFDGWIEKLYVEYEGEMVKKGQPLLEIYSPELVSTQEELLIAARYRDATSVSPFSDISRGGENLFEAARRRLVLWDIPTRDINRLLAERVVRKTLTLYAPASGVVTHLMVRNGMEVGANNNLYTIADLARVWVYADVYEYELPWIAVGQKATVELSYLPGSNFEGTVTYVYPFLDPKTRTARVRIELENPDMVLKPDMFANVRIATQSRDDVIAIPEEAVIRSGRRTLVIVDAGEGHFSPRDVKLGLDSGQGWLEIRSGIREGERIVTSGQFLIDSESKLQEAVQKLLAGDKEAGAPAEHAMSEAEMRDMGGPDHTMPSGQMPEQAHDMPSHDGSTEE